MVTIFTNNQREQVTKVIESTFNSLCDIYEYEKVIGDNKATVINEVLAFSNIPCKVSFNGIGKVMENDVGTKTLQVVKLFLPFSVNVKSGSKIIVTYDNNIYTFKNSSTSINYLTHQEVILEDYKNWA